MSILLLRYAKSRLLLNIDGDVKEFFDNDDKTMSKAFPDNLIYETEDVTNSFSSYLAIIGIYGSQMMTAPANYDGDDLELKMYELSETLEYNAEFYSWTYNMDQSQEPVNTDTESIKMSPQYRFIYYKATVQHKTIVVEYVLSKVLKEYKESK